jgi:cytochrome P450
MSTYFLNELARYRNNSKVITPMKVFGESFYFTNNERFIRYIEKENPSNFSGGMGMGSCEEFNFCGVINKDREFSDTLRALIPPRFTWTDVEEDFKIIADATEQLCTGWIAESRRESVINIELEFQRLALSLASQLFISPDLELNVDPVLDGISDLMEISDLAKHPANRRRKRYSRVLPFLKNVTPLYDAALEFVDLLAGQLTEEYLRKNTKKGLLFDKIFQAHASSKVEYNSIIPITKYFIMTASLPVAELLTWMFYSIDSIPGLRKKLEDEVADTTGKGELTLTAVNNMTLMRSVILETMRFYAPVTIYQKTTYYKDEFEGAVIPQNSHILISPYTLHRKPELWKDGETFIPGRFINSEPPENGFMPFGDNFINNASIDIITLEMQMITAVLLRKTHIYYQMKELPVFRATPVISPTQRILALAVKIGNEGLE